MIAVMLIGNGTPDDVGIIPGFLDESDPRPANEQFDENYSFGGGWMPMEGFTRSKTVFPTLKYPGDRMMHPLALISFRDERIFVYPHAFVMILQKDGSFEVARMD